MKKKLTFILAAVILAGAGAGAWLWHYVSQGYDGSESVRIYIPSGADALAVADTLTGVLGEKFGSAVAGIWSARSGNAHRATGSYVVRPGDKAWSVANRLRSGSQTPVRVTFNNVRLLDDLAGKVSARFEWDAALFLAAADSVLPGLGFKGREQYPAAFVPDTYEFYWTDSPVKVVGALAAERNRFWNDERRAKAGSLGLTPVEVATLASIVEEETSKSDEKPKVARLYMNRLAKGMKLQADPTVKFALGDFTLRRLFEKHLGVSSPYNTYAVAGLPPGPIRIPERATMEAVLSAPEHPYLYMCARPDFSGYHNFAADYAAHQKNAAAYRAELNRLNIR